MHYQQVCMYMHTVVQYTGAHAYKLCVHFQFNTYNIHTGVYTEMG